MKVILGTLIIFFVLIYPVQVKAAAESASISSEALNKALEVGASTAPSEAKVQSQKSIINTKVIPIMMNIIAKYLTVENAKVLSEKIEGTGVINKTQTIGEEKVSEVSSQTFGELRNYLDNLKQDLAPYLNISAFLFQGDNIYQNYLDSLKRKNDSLMGETVKEESKPQRKSFTENINQKFKKMISSEYSGTSR